MPLYLYDDMFTRNQTISAYYLSYLIPKIHVPNTWCVAYQQIWIQTRNRLRSMLAHLLLPVDFFSLTRLITPKTYFFVVKDFDRVWNWNYYFTPIYSYDDDDGCEQVCTRDKTYRKRKLSKVVLLVYQLSSLYTRFDVNFDWTTETFRIFLNSKSIF